METAKKNGNILSNRGKACPSFRSKRNATTQSKQNGTQVGGRTGYDDEGGGLMVVGEEGGGALAEHEVVLTLSLVAAVTSVLVTGW